MNIQDLIEDLLVELSYQSPTGVPDLKDRETIRSIYEYFSEMGLSELGQELINNLLSEEDEKQFKNPALNKVIKYKNVNGQDAEGKVGNLLRRPKEEDAYKKAVASLGGEDTDIFKQAMSDLGGENQPNRDIEKEKEKKDDGGNISQDNQPETGTALNPDTEAGKNFTDQLSPSDNAYTGDEESDSLSPESDSEETELSNEELLQVDHDTTDAQLNMTKTEAAAQAKKKGEKKDVGAGTAESRAGEAMIHKGLRLLKEGKSIEEIEQYFKDLVNGKDHILNSKTGKKWVNAAIATIQKIDEVIGIENIEDVAWDTPQGRTALGIDEGLKTSSDMFIKTKDGEVIGVSLKKDGKVFLNNGGWAKQSVLLLESLKSEMPEDDHQKLSEAMSIDAYKKDLEDRFRKTTETITSDVLKKSFKRLLDNPQDQKEFQGSERETYFKILSNPDLLLKKIKMGTANVNEQKAYAKLLQTYHKDEYDYLRQSDEGLTRRAFNVLNQSDEAKKGMNRHIIKSMHIMETLGLDSEVKEGGVDKFMTFYGIEPDGAVLNEQTLITLFGMGFKERLDEGIKEVRKGNLTPKDLEDFIVDSIEIDYESGQILFKHESNKKFPLFKMAGRTRGIGSSPVMEMAQTPFMAHALKMGTFNTDEWDSRSLEKFQKDIIESETE